MTLNATRLWQSAELDPADRDALARACDDVRHVRSGTQLVRQGEPCETLFLLLDGWAARSKLMGDGSRLIPVLTTPGELCNLDTLKFDRLDYGTTMLTNGTVALLPRQRVQELHASNPNIASAFWSLALAENSVLTEWAASIGRRSAQDRLAHLLCELLVRLTVAGKADGLSFDLPLTQEQTADALGLTPVHVNRMLQALRTEGLITTQGRRVTINNWAGLASRGDFQSDYLHLETINDELAPELPSTGARRGSTTHIHRPRSDRSHLNPPVPVRP